MTGIIWLAAMLAAGVFAADRIFSEHPLQYRLVFGLALGLTGAMWLPALFAFFLRFTAKAQWLALGTAWPAALCSRFIKKRPQNGHDAPPVWLVLACVVPFLILSGYLQYTHTFRNIDGSLYVGQSTYGDLAMHAGFATGFVDSAFPPEYTILPGNLLGYPFLADALSASLLCLGTELDLAFIVPSTIMMGLVFWSFLLLAWRFTGRKVSCALAFLLMFLNGGLGFLYIKGWFGALFGMTNENAVTLYEVLNGYYQAPANMPALNLRWVNVICDMMIPQRTLLAGWAVGIPMFILLRDCVEGKHIRDFIRLGIWAGFLPMIHTHTFLALGMISLGCMIFCCVRGEEADRAKALKGFLIYGVIAAAIAAGQLLKWTFPQTAGGGSLRLQFNWVNNNGSEEGLLRDGYFWFWLKNVGPVALALFPAVFAGRGEAKRAMGVGALLLFLLSEFVLFQPNEYDNNKLFYIVFIVLLPDAADLIVRLAEMIRPRAARYALAALFLYFSLTSGVLSVARETVSQYRLFSADEAEAAEYIAANTEKTDIMLTGLQHANAPAVLAGHSIVCGSGSYLYYHGMDYWDQQTAAVEMYRSPGTSAALFELYDVDYVYVSAEHELSNWTGDAINAGTVDLNYMEENFDVFYRNDSVTVYDVRNWRAKNFNN